MPETVQRVAVVTGAAQGIGRAVARRLAQGGAAVAVLDCNEAGAEEAANDIVARGGTAMAVRADVGDTAEVGAAVEKVAETLGPPAVLVNNAGIVRDALLFRMGDLEWDDVIRVHLRGAFLMSRAVQGHMVSRRWGRIISITSTVSQGNRGQANYAAAKAGLIGFTRTLAIELGPFGVTANAVGPGYINTPMSEAAARRLGVPFDEFTDRLVARIPVGRAGEPEDVAAAVDYLAGEDASFVSGQVLYVAGGPVG